MVRKPSYEDLENKIKELESLTVECGRKLCSSEDLTCLDFRRLAERSQDAIYHYDLSGERFLFFNDPFYELFKNRESSRERLTLDQVHLRVHPEDRTLAQQAMNRSIKPPQRGGEAEYRIIREDGSLHWIQDRWIVIRDDTGRARAVEGFIRDTTQLKTADAKLMARMDRAPLGSYILQNGKFRHVNPEFLRITSFSMRELTNIRSLDLVHEEYRDYVRGCATRMLNGELNEPYEFCVLTKDGEFKWIMESVASVQYDGQRATLGYFMDITKVRSVQHNLASMGLMIGAVSHSLKGLLTGLDAALYLVDTGFYRNKPARIEEGLDAGKLMLDRLGKIVGDVLYYVKEREPAPERTDVLQFTQELAASVERRMRGADIHFSFLPTPNAGYFEIDRDLLRPALLNLLENSLEACIADTEKKQHSVEFIVQGSDDMVLMEVGDNGPGMDEEQQKKAFTLFYSSKGKRGTGLGLFITKEVINQHGGGVGVHSSPGRGARFKLNLPRKAKVRKH